MLDDWKRASESLHDALRMPVGTPPRAWRDKLEFAAEAERLLASVLEEWSLRPPHGRGEG
ncbi:MAG: hypothetical protein ACXWJ7_01945 [Caldimonas sp.]